ncbi:hypothetical protein [Tessaracoccus sp.]
MTTTPAQPPTTPDLTWRTENVAYIDGLPLRLSFEPSAIREHYEDSDVDVSALTDEQLALVGANALGEDNLYRAFHDALTITLEDLFPAVFTNPNTQVDTGLEADLKLVRKITGNDDMPLINEEPS